MSKPPSALLQCQVYTNYALLQCTFGDTPPSDMLATSARMTHTFKYCGYWVRSEANARNIILMHPHANRFVAVVYYGWPENLRYLP